MRFEVSVPLLHDYIVAYLGSNMSPKKRVKNTAAPREIEQIALGCFSKGLSNASKSDDLTEVAAEYCECVLDVLRLTLRLVKKVLVEGLQLALEGECPTKVVLTRSWLLLRTVDQSATV